MISIEEMEKFNPLEDIKNISAQVSIFQYYLEETGQMSSVTWCRLDGIEKLLDELLVDLGGERNAPNAFD